MLKVQELKCSVSDVQMISDMEMLLIISSKDATAKVRRLKYYNDVFNNTLLIVV